MCWPCSSVTKLCIRDINPVPVLRILSQNVEHCAVSTLAIALNHHSELVRSVSVGPCSTSQLVPLKAHLYTLCVHGCTCTVSHCRGLVCLTCWPSARVLELLSCTSTKVQSPSLPSTAVWRECTTVQPLRVCQSAVWMQVSGVQHWVSCCVGAVWCTFPMALSVSNVFHE